VGEGAAAARVDWARSGRGLGWSNARERLNRPTTPSCHMVLKAKRFE
jgi:hypothetical protein